MKRVKASKKEKLERLKRRFWFFVVLLNLAIFLGLVYIVILLGRLLKAS